MLITVLLIVVATVSVCATEIDIIPRPSAVRTAEGRFALNAAVMLHVDVSGDEADDAVRCLGERLRSGAGLDLAIRSGPLRPTPQTILLTTKNANAGLGDEGYTLDVTPETIVLRATHAAGLFYGVQTLLQLLPPPVYSASPSVLVACEIPCISISDSPRFRWRGLMLDVARHFFAKADVLRLLDQMAVHKLNVLHWHLTDDQGWRIEIKKYPRLTEIGAWRDEAGFGLDPTLSDTYGRDGKYGGFYTHDDVREVVAYATARHILVVPEIDMPGHATAVLRAYPQYATPAAPSDQTKGDAGIFNAVYDPSNEETFTFLQDVLTEVIDLFPSPYVHIGGDEVPKEPWQNYAGTQVFMGQNDLADGEALQSYFIKRIGGFLSSRGRRMLGWDEILEGGVAPGAVVMSWRGVDGGVAAANSGHDVVMSPTGFCYFDGEQGLDTEPHERGAVLHAKKVYAYEPIPAGLPVDRVHHVLGVQGNLWTEYVPNFRWAEYMLWPRAAALAEVGWSPAAERDWDDFSRRLVIHERRLDAMRVDYRPLLTDAIQDAITTRGGQLFISDAVAGGVPHFTLDGTFPSLDSPAYAGPVALPGGWVQANVRYFVPGRIATPVAAANFLDGHAVRLTCTSAKDYETRHALFYTPRWGGGANHTVTVAFVAGPQVVRSIVIDTGTEASPEGQVVLDQAYLEISTDGTTFAPAADFVDGIARAELNGVGVAAFRVRFLVLTRPYPVLRSVSIV